MEYCFIAVGGLIIALGVYFLLIAPRITVAPDMSPFVGVTYAHRGMWGEGIPENSLDAVHRAVNNGYGIEIDIRLTKDGVPVVFHDADLLRMTGDRRAVSELTYEELSRLFLQGSRQRIPTLKEVLEAVAGDVPIIIELKYGEDGELLAQAALKWLTSYVGAYCVESFDPRLLRNFACHAPHIPRGILSGGFGGKGAKYSPRLSPTEGESKPRGLHIAMHRRLLFNFLVRPDFIAYDIRYAPSRPLMLCRALGAKTFAWTVRDERDFDYSKAYFDSQICENLEER